MKTGSKTIEKEIGKDEELDMGQEDSCPPKCPTQREIDEAHKDVKKELQIKLNRKGIKGYYIWDAFNDFKLYHDDVITRKRNKHKALLE